MLHIKYIGLPVEKEAHPCVQVVQGDEDLYAEAAISMTVWNKGELENDV